MASSQVLSSNANSALISTLSASDAIVNPFVYSLEKLLPFGSKYTTDIIPVQGSGQTFGPSSVIDFDLPKYGMLQNLCLEFGLLSNDGTIAGSTAGLSVIGALGAIDHIEFLSSSRRTLNLTYKDIMCMYSDMPHAQRAGIIASLTAYPASGDMTTATHASHHSPRYQIMIPFALFFNHKLNPNLLFQEPLRCRVHLANLNFGAGSNHPDNKNSTDSIQRVYSPVINAEYFTAPREMEDAIITENYGDGSLSTVCYDWSDEVETVGPALTQLSAYSDTGYMECEIKNIGVVSDIYFMVSIDKENTVTGAKGTASPTADNVLTVALKSRHRGAEAIVRCELLANGQVMYSKTGEEMKLWGRKSDSIYPYTMSQETATANVLDNIYKIPLCLSDDKRFPTGGISLRELHNVRLRVWYKVNTGGGATNNLTAGAFPTTTVLVTNETSKNSVRPSLKVMCRNYQILTTEASTGRVITSIAN
jgi:hypothetical protein